MDMSYRVLWFDDNPTSIDGAIRSLESRLNGLGLSLHVEKVSSFDDGTINPILMRLRNQLPYDLIMVDYDLGNTGGDELLRRLRQSTMCEMVFYSAVPVRELRQRLFNQDIDGVFCMHRDQLAASVFAIAQSAFRRITRPHYMRGIVVGAVGEIDNLFAEVIEGLMAVPGLTSEAEVRELLRAGYETSLAEEQSKLDRFDQTRIDRLIERANLHIKVNIVLSLLHRQGGREAVEAHSVLERFLAEVNQHRIEFAHAKSAVEDGVPVFRSRNGRVWTPRDMQDLLLRIREQREAAASVSQIFRAQG